MQRWSCVALVWTAAVTATHAVADNAPTTRTGDDGLIQGAWALVELDGHDVQTFKDPTDGTTVHFAGHQLFFLRGENQRVGVRDFQLTAGATPKQINLVPIDGPNKGKTIRGIYELVGDRLRLCFSAPDRLGTRPTEFGCSDGNVVIIRQRANAK